MRFCASARSKAHSSPAARYSTSNFRRFSLGKDPAKGNSFSLSEMQTALRVEAGRGVQLTRDASGDLEWYDQAGRGYDAVGNFDGKDFNLKSFTDSIIDHLRKTDAGGHPVSFIPVDTTQFTADQIAQIKDFVGGLSPADQARILYVHAG